MKDTQKSAKSAIIDKTSEEWADEERAAMKECHQELKAAARRGPSWDKVDGEGAVLAKIAEMQETDRAMGERLHAVIKASAPALSPRLWDGMPADAKDGNVPAGVLCRAQRADPRDGYGAPVVFEARGPSREPHPVSVGPFRLDPGEPDLGSLALALSGLAPVGQSCDQISDP